MTQCLLEVGNLPAQFALGGLVLSVLLFDLRQVLELDSLSLKYCTLHVLDHLLLLLSQSLVSEFHAMNFDFHGDDLGLTDVGVECLLHLAFELNLAFP